MRVRSFHLADYSSVTQILEEVLTEDCYVDTMEAFSRQLSCDPDLVLIAEKNGSIVGIIIGTIDNNKGYFYRVAVNVAHQRQGIGRKLVEAMKNRFEQRKVSQILVRVDSHNEPFLRVYESSGYQSIDFSRSTGKLKICIG